MRRKLDVEDSLRSDIEVREKVWLIVEYRKRRSHEKLEGLKID